MIVIISVLGCKTPKTVYKNVETHDTIVITEVIKVVQPRLTNLIVDSPCDSLGRLKPIFYETITPTKTLSIKTIDNKLVITEKQDSTVVQKVVDKQTNSVSTSDEIKLLIKTPKWAYYSLILNVLLLVWVARKLIKPLL